MEVHQLIHSLTKAEKRFFNRFSTMTGGESNSLNQKLLKILLDQEIWDAKQFADRLRAITTGKPSLHLSRLKMQVLRSQRCLHETRSIDGQLRVLLADIEFLYGNQAIHLCKRRLTKAHKMAVRFEKGSQLMECLQWERRLQSFSPETNREQAFLDLNQQELACLERMHRQSGYTHLLELITNLARQESRIRSQSIRDRFTQILAHPLMEQPPAESELISWICFRMVRAIYLICDGQYHDALTLLEPVLNRWESLPERIADSAHLYVRFCGYYLSSLIFSAPSYEMLQQNLTRLRTPLQASPTIGLEFEQRSYYQQLLFALNFEAYDRVDALVTEISDWLHLNPIAVGSSRLNITRRIVLYYNIAIFYFLYGEFTAANHWNNKILNLPSKSERLDIRDFARIFQLILQYELGNNDLNEYLSRSASRYLNRTGKLFDLDHAILRFMEEAYAPTTLSSTSEQFESLHSTISSIMNREGERNPLGIHEISMWIDSKRKNIPLPAMMESNVLQNRKQRAKNQNPG